MVRKNLTEPFTVRWPVKAILRGSITERAEREVPSWGFMERF